MRICPIILAVLTVAVFAAAGSFGLVNCDDYQYVVEGARHYGWGWCFTQVGDAMWTPLTYLSYWFDRTLFGENWGAYHWHNIMWHAADAVLLFFLLRVLMGVRHVWASLVIALLWAIHPLRVESVVWIAGRKDVISTFFFLLALLAWVRASRNIHLALALLLLGVGGLAKASVMVFPAFALAWDGLIARRFRPWWAYLAAAALSVGLAVEAGWAQQAGGACAITDEIPLAYRALNAFCALTVYGYNLVFPRDLALQCLLRYPSVPRFEMVGLIVLGGAVWYGARHVVRMVRDREWRRDVPLAGLLAGLAAFVPFLGIAGFGIHAFADRFTLLPSVGFALALAGVYLQIEKKSVRRVAFAAGVATVVPLGLQARVQTAYWRDTPTIFEHTLAVDGNRNLMAHKALLVHYWEYPHDMQKVYEHTLAAMDGVAWQEDWISVLGYMGVEAAFETGHPEGGRDICMWVYRATNRQLKDVQRQDPTIKTSIHYLIADAVRLAYTDDCLDLAREKLRDLEGHYGKADDMGVRNLRYVIARRGGDATEIAAARARVYVEDGEYGAHNRWAKCWAINKKGHQDELERK